MKTRVTFAALAAGAFALSSCGGKTEEAPAAEPTAAEPEAMTAEAPAETPGVDPAETAADGNDPTNNPIRPSAAGEAAPAAGEAAPAAE